MSKRGDGELCVIVTFRDEVPPGVGVKFWAWTTICLVVLMPPVHVALPSGMSTVSPSDAAFTAACTAAKEALVAVMLAAEMLPPTARTAATATACFKLNPVKRRRCRRSLIFIAGHSLLRSRLGPDTGISGRTSMHRLQRAGDGGQHVKQIMCRRFEGATPIGDKNGNRRRNRLPISI